MKASLVVLAIVTSAAATASQWQIVGTSRSKPDRRVLMVDADSVHRNADNTVLFWEFTYYETPDKTFDYAKNSKAQMRMDCENQRQGMTALVLYSASDKVLETIDFTSTFQYSAIVPDTVADSVSKYICGKASRVLPLPAGETPESFAANLFQQ